MFLFSSELSLVLGTGQENSQQLSEGEPEGDPCWALPLLSAMHTNAMKQVISSHTELFLVGSNSCRSRNDSGKRTKHKGAWGHLQGQASSHAKEEKPMVIYPPVAQHPQALWDVHLASLCFFSVSMQH